MRFVLEMLKVSMHRFAASVVKQTTTPSCSILNCMVGLSIHHRVIHPNVRFLHAEILVRYVESSSTHCLSISMVAPQSVTEYLQSCHCVGYIGRYLVRRQVCLGTSHQKFAVRSHDKDHHRGIHAVRLKRSHALMLARSCRKIVTCFKRITAFSTALQVPTTSFYQDIEGGTRSCVCRSNQQSLSYLNITNMRSFRSASRTLTTDWL